MFRCHHLFLLLRLSVGGESDGGLRQEDCSSISVPIDTFANLSLFTVRHSSKGKHCTVECDPNATQASQFVMGCIFFGDWVNQVMSADGLRLKEGCQETTIEAPGKEPHTFDPEMAFISCPSWFLYTGWDRGTERKMGSMRHELVLKTPKALEAFKNGLVADEVKTKEGMAKQGRNFSRLEEVATEREVAAVGGGATRHRQGAISSFASGSLGIVVAAAVGSAVALSVRWVRSSSRALLYEATAVDPDCEGPVTEIL